MKKIAVVGSLNMDLVIEVNRVPLKGETLLGSNFFTSPGGKGANQAVATARLGGDVTFYGCAGKDEFGSQLATNLQKNGVKPVIKPVDNSTGVALINIYDDDNSIVVASGANDFYSDEYVEFLKTELANFDLILFQLETNIKLLEALVPYLHERNKCIILNPAPAVKLPQEILTMITYLTPNEHECQVIYESSESLEKLVKEKSGQLLVTCGAEGVLFYDEELKVEPPIKVNQVIDTTGAGDTFSGAFTYALAVDMPLTEAVSFANIAAGLSIQAKGAQGGMPTLQEVNTYQKETTK